MNGFRSLCALWSLGALLGLLVSPITAASDYCRGEVPESVLQCYSTAYAQRDSASFAALLAPDFTHIDLDHPQWDSSDYVGTVRLAAYLFKAPNVDRVEMSFGRPTAVESGADPRTWTIRDVPTVLHIDGTSDEGTPGPFEITKLITFSVRLVSEPTPHFVIFREELREAERK